MAKGGGNSEAARIDAKIGNRTYYVKWYEVTV